MASDEVIVFHDNLMDELDKIKAIGNDEMHNMAEVGNGIRPLNDNPTTAAGRMYMDFDMPYVESSDDLDYDDLCTLESLLSYFKHDESLDMEIAALKEKALLSKCKELKDKIDFMKADDVSCSMKGCNAADKYTDKGKCADALMLMSYINHTDMPADNISYYKHIINAAMERPSILLNYIAEDVQLTWPIRRIVDGQAVMVSHGIRTKETAAMDGD